MDNLTHSVLGLVMGEMGHRIVKPHDSDRIRYRFWIVSLLSNNVPDIDILYTGITGGKLGYLLHHRGHSHTLVGVWVLGLLVGCVFHFYARVQRFQTTKAETQGIWGLSFLGPMLHIALDSLNSYGVHPFWPFNNRWYYGDSLFIIEPILWVHLLAPFLFVGSKVLRAVCGLLLLVLLLLCWWSEWIPIPICTALTLWTAFLGMIGLSLSNGRYLQVCLGLSAAVVVGFLAMSSQVRAFVKDSIAKESTEFLEDAVLTPLPANPFCWSVVSLQRGATTYKLRRGLFELFGSCPPFRFSNSSTALIEEMTNPHPSLHWLGYFEESLSSLKRIQEHCGVSAWLRFSRVPFFKKEQNYILVGDLRFDREAELGFSEIRFLHPADSCPTWVPPWKAPRESLLTGK